MKHALPIYTWTTAIMILAFALGLKVTGTYPQPFFLDAHDVGSRFIGLFQHQPEPDFFHRLWRH